MLMLLDVAFGSSDRVLPGIRRAWRRSVVSLASLLSAVIVLVCAHALPAAGADDAWFDAAIAGNVAEVERLIDAGARVDEWDR